MSKNYNEDKLKKAINTFIKTIDFDTSDFGTNKDLGISIGSVSFVYSSSKLEDIKYIIEKSDIYRGVNFKGNFESKLIIFIGNGLSNKIQFDSKIEFKNKKQKEYFFKCLINKFLNGEMQEFYVLLPISGLFFKEKHASLGILDLYSFDQKQKVVDEILNKKIELKNFNTILPDKNPFAKIKVKAPYEETARQIGTDTLQGILNAYQLLSGKFKIKNKLSVTDPSKTYLPSAIGINLNTKRIIGESEKRYMPLNFQNIQNIINNEIKDYDFLKSNYIKKINNIAKKLLNDEKITPFEQNIWIANRLIAEGIQAVNYQDKITKLMSGIEALLETREKLISLKLRKAVIILYCNLENEYIIKEFNDKFKNLYKIRSNILHGENINVAEQDINLLLNISTSIILIMVKDFKIYNKEKDNKKIILKNKINFEYNKLIKKFPSLKNHISPKK